MEPLVNLVPRTRSDYSPDGLQFVRSTCLDLAICLNDYWDDLVVVGGFVPSLLVTPRADVEAHLGTNDIDIGLALSLVESGRYEDMARRLRTVGYQPDINDDGQPVHHRWRLDDARAPVTVDFLIENQDDGIDPGKPFHLSKEFGPIRNDALPAAFLDRIDVEVAGQTPRGEDAKRVVRVCGPAAFVVLKAHALHSRGYPKDAYDLFYMIRNYGESGPEDVAARWDRVAALPSAIEALEMLREDAESRTSVLPMRAAEFLELRGDDGFLSEVLGFTRRFIDRVS